MAGTLDDLLPPPAPPPPGERRSAARFLAVLPFSICLWNFVPLSVALLDGRETRMDCEVYVVEWRDSRSRTHYDRRVSCSYMVDGSFYHKGLWAPDQPMGRFETSVRYARSRPQWSTAPRYVGEDIAWVVFFFLAAVTWWSYADAIIPLLGARYRS